MSFQNGDGHVVELQENYRLIGFPRVVYDVIVTTHALEIVYLPALMRSLFSNRIPDSIMGHMLSFVSAGRFKIASSVEVSFVGGALQTVSLALTTPYRFDGYVLTGNGDSQICLAQVTQDR